MEFFIKKNATLPVLKMQVVKDGRGEYEEFMRFIETSTLYFSMQNIENGSTKINTKFAGFVEKEFIEPNSEDEYYLYYRFNKQDTNRVGRYEGQFLLKNDSGTLILPIREKLFINILDSNLEDDLDYDACYTSKFECCIIGTPPFITPTVTPTLTPTPSVTVTISLTPSSTNDVIQTSTPTPTSTLTQTPTNTNTPTVTLTVSQTINPTETPTQTPTITNTITSSETPTQTPTITTTTTETPTITPTSTLTPTITLTMTPSSTDTTISLLLDAFYEPGSVIANYILSSNRNVSEDVTVSFTNVLGVLSGPPITIITGVTIANGNTSGSTIINLGDNYDNLDRSSVFSAVTVSYTGSTFTYPVNEQPIFVTPTPTTTPTNTVSITPTYSNGFVEPSPTVTPTITETPTVTPTITETPTVTPTITETPTISVTPTITPTTSAFVCNCINFFNTGTTGNGTVDYVNCSGLTSQVTIPPGDFAQVCVRNPLYTASTQIGVTYLVGDCTLGCPAINANSGVFVLNNQDRIIYLYDSDTNTQIPLPISLSAATPYDIATNDNLLWVFGVFTGSTGSVTGIKEFTINRTQFSASLNRFITVGSNLFPSAQNGLAVVNNTTLLVASGATGTQIASLDITTTAATATLLFNLPSQRGLRGDLVYTDTGKIIASTYNIVSLSDSRLQQYDYTGTLEVDFSIGNAGNGFSFYVWNSEFYTVLCGTSSATRGKRSLSSPYGSTSATTMTISNVGMAQRLSEYSINFIPVTPTPTPTITRTPVTPTVTPTNTKTPTITPTITPTNTMTPTITTSQINYSTDPIYSLLSATGKTAYSAASVNSFFSVSQSDYNNIMTGLTSTTVYGVPTDIFLTGSPISQFVGGWSIIDGGQTGITAGNYILGYAMRPGRALAANATRLISGNTINGTYTYLGTGTNSFTSSSVLYTPVYFLQKLPTVPTVGTSTYIGLYTQDNVAYLSGTSTRTLYYGSSLGPGWLSNTFNQIAYQVLINNNKTW